MLGGSAQNESDPSSLEWTIASLPGLGSVDLTFRATVDTGAKAFNPITNTASLTSVDQVDSDSGNNIGEVDINVVGLDLEVLKSVNVNNPEEGETITYSITVENTSSQPATDVVITDTVPNGVSYVLGTISGGSGQNESDPESLVWTIATLGANSTQTLTFDATVDSGAKALNPIVNSATLTSVDQSEENAANNTDTAEITVRGLDISVAKTVNEAAPTEGNPVTYTIVVTNNSSQTATNVIIQDPVPADLTYVPGSISGGDVEDESAPATGLTWNIGTLAGGENRNLTFDAIVNAGASASNPITNTASLVSISESEDNAANNSGSVDINAVTFDVAVTKAVSVADPEEGEEITYTITVENTSGADGTNVVITDSVPNGVTYVPTSITGGDTQDANDPDSLVWTISNLAGGTSRTLTFRATVDVGAKALNPITNSVTLTSVDQIDSDSGNDTGTVDILVKGLDIAVTKAVSKNILKKVKQSLTQ